MDRPARQEDGICLLSLDGGGPGSLSQLRIIGEYMERLAHDRGVDVDSLFPADIFDAIGGTGFGAYIALLIGPLRMSVTQATEELINLGTALFPPEQEEMPSAEENSKRLKEAVEEMVERQQLPIDIKLKDARLPGSHCKVVVFASPCNNATHCVPLRAYSSRERSIDCTLVEAACATLAIPPLFEPVLIGPARRQQVFASACISFNNPTRELLKEATKLFGRDRQVSTMISIGSGPSSTPNIDSLLSQPTGHDDILKRIGMEAEKVSRELSSQLFNVNAYLRLNVDRGIEDFKMTDWNDLGTIEGHADVYLQGTAVSNAVDLSVRTLQNKIGLVNLGQLTLSSQVQTQAKKAPAVSPYFVVRQEYWVAMEQHLVGVPEAKRKIMVLSGMGGSGKTQMVAYFVHKYHSRYQHIFFVDASSPSSIQGDLQSAIRALGVGYEQKTYEDAITFLTNSPRDTNWLFILDNADNPDLNLAQYLPECYHGSIIITTRNLGFGRLSNTAHLQLGPMGESEAYEALVRAAHRTLPLSPDEDKFAKELMRELGNLPVALVQAGSYCYNLSSASSNGGSSYEFGQYVSLFKQHRKELMKKGDKDSLDRYSRGVYTTLDLSYSLLSQSARELLHMCGFFHHTDISLAMLEYAVQNNFRDRNRFLVRPEAHNMVVERLRMHLCPSGRWNEIHIHDTIHSLQSFSLVSTTSISGTVFLRFHPLVHVWSRDSLAAREDETFRRMATQVIVSCVSPNVTFYRFLLPHIMAIIGEESPVQMHVNDMMGFGRALLELGWYSRATSLFEDSLMMMKDELGKNHLDTIIVSSWVAQAYWKQGRWDEAEKIDEEALEQRQRLLSKDHPDTIRAAVNLAATYREQGKWAEAEKIQVEVLEQRQRLLSRDHPRTISAASNLALTYYEQGKLKEAEKIQIEVLEQRQRLLNRDHPDTISAAAHLAVTYRVQGKWKEAEKIQIEVLEQRQKLLSKEHPRTINAAAQLASTYRKLGRWKEAEKMEVEVLEQRQRLLGKEHLDTINAAANLAATYHSQGRWTEAEQIDVEVLKQRQRLLSKDHPDTILATTDLAMTLFMEGRCQEAKELQTEAVDTAKRVLGADHPRTVSYIENLAYMRHTSS